MHVELERREVLVREERQTRRRHAIDLADHARVVQPLKGRLVFACPCTGLERRVDELLVFLGKLRRNILPEQPYLPEQLGRRMLHEVGVIGLKDVRLDATYRRVVSRRGEFGDGFGHAADKQVFPKQRLVQAVKPVDDCPVSAFQRLKAHLRVNGLNEFLEGERMNVEKADLPYRKGCLSPFTAVTRLAHRESEQRSGDEYGQFGHLLVEVLKCIERFGRFLNLINDQQRLSWRNDFPRKSLDEINQPLWLKIGAVDLLLQCLGFLQVDPYRIIRIVGFGELIHQPGLPDLTRPHQNERLPLC